MNFSRLQTPAEHEDVLVEPDAPGLSRAIEENVALIAGYDFPLQDLSVREARDITIGRLEAPQGPVIVTGHQPEFIHAGVWAKHVVAHRLAEATGGSALNLIVDNDAPKQTAIPVPSVGGGRLNARKIAYAQWPAGSAFEGFPPAGCDEARRFAQEVRTALGSLDKQSMLRTFFDQYVRHAEEGDWVDQQVAGRKAVEAELGVHMSDHRVSRVWCGPVLGAMLAEPDRFADSYNRALASYRTRYGVRGTQRPVPDLHRDADLCELAVWAYRTREPRRRAFVKRRGSTITLLAGDEPFAEIDAACVTKWHKLCPEIDAFSPWVIRPRALTLTLWARLLLADIFIHGIGGAKYDRVTDDLTRNFFGVEPPRMACVSATLCLDLPRHAIERGAIAGATHRLRDLEYNPQRYAEEATAGELIAARDRAVLESQRLRNESPRNRTARRRVFNEIRALNDRINHASPSLRTRFAEQLDTLHRFEGENRTATSREYFFAMHARSDLDLLLYNLPSVQDMR